MVSAVNDLSKQQEDHGYGVYSRTGSLGGNIINVVMRRVKGYNCSYNTSIDCSESCLGSDLLVTHMAEDDSRTNSLNEAAGSGSGSGPKVEARIDKDEAWLQLSIACQTPTVSTTSTNTNHHHHQAATISMPPITAASPLVELDLLPAGHSNSSQARPLEVAMPMPMYQVPEIRASPRALLSYPPPPLPPTAAASSFSTSLLFQHPNAATTASGPSFAQEINWSFGPIPHSMGMPPPPPSSSSSSSSSQSSSSSLRPLGLYFPRPFHFPAGCDVPGPSSDVIRVVDPPRRPHSGIWFMLQASQNQAKEPFLPQIPKSYLRIKDGRMTVRLLLKYLVNKLSLDNESEVEISCRGQQLLPFLTLQHVRDNIWTQRDTPISLLSDSSTSDHIMLLHYGRSA